MELNYTFIEENQSIIDNLQNIANLKRFSYDVETTGLDPHTDKLLLIQLGNQEKQFLIDARKTDVSLLNPIMSDESLFKSGANLMFDYKWGLIYDYVTESLIDIQLAERILHAGKVHFKTPGFYSLEGIALRRLGIKLNKDVRDSFLIHSGRFTHEQLEYAAYDIITPSLIFEQQRKELIKESLMNTFVLECNAIQAFGEMELNGIYLDSEGWIKLYDENVKNFKNYRGVARELFRPIWDINLLNEVDINLNADEKVKFALKKLGYDLPNTAEETLEAYLPPDIYEPILKYREFQTNISRYGQSFVDAINPVTKRIHPNYWQIGAATGRPSSDDPNLLNIKRESKYRTCFKAQNDDAMFIVIDYAGQELRIAAEITQEERWIEDFKKGRNVHLDVGSYILSELTGKKVQLEKSHDKYIDVLGSKVNMGNLYNNIKNTNFGIIYGAGAYRIYLQFLKAGIKNAKLDHGRAIVEYHKQYLTKLHEGLDNIRSEAIHLGYTTSFSGRKRYFPKFEVEDMKGKDDNERYKNYQKRLYGYRREGGNHSVQGSGCDELKKSLYLIRKQIRKKNIQDKLKLIIPLYDETVSESESDHEEHNEMIRNCMLAAQEFYQMTVPGEVEGGVTKCWSH